MAQAAQGADPELHGAVLPGGQEPREVYSNGARTDPEDPLTARAAWAFAIPGGWGGTWAGP
eukprot:9990128-Lingulodinium_polyedra.AAC.1